MKREGFGGTWTISQVADRAGVSVATISRVLNDSPLVAEKTKAHVRQVIGELDFHPNGVARNLRSSKCQLILALVRSISNPFYSMIVHGANEVVHARNYNLLLCETNASHGREDAFFGMLKRKIVEGLICLDPEVSEKNLREFGQEYPIVRCCEYSAAVPVPSVTIDDEAAARLAVSHLAETGCRRIALVNVAGDRGWSRQRRQGYEVALEDHGLAVDPALMFSYQVGRESGAAVAARILAAGIVPDGIFVVSDVMAVGVLRTLVAAGLRVPDDVSVVGFDNIDLTTICRPTLTSVAQPMHRIGRTAAEQLFSRIEGQRIGNGQTILPHGLVVRESTRRSFSETML